MQWYVVAYVLAFHYSRPIVATLRPRVRTLRLNSSCALFVFISTLGCGAWWSWMYYPNKLLNGGFDRAHSSSLWVAAELVVPLLLLCGCIFSLAWCPISLRFSGSSTLGTYLTHLLVHDDW